ncbi:transposase IS66 [Alicyclobacillus hesperidum URH17-3-68]|nr:transposase IS66 [Alicyclobacillus hesperidum URH17-3-68]
MVRTDEVAFETLLPWSKALPEGIRAKVKTKSKETSPEMTELFHGHNATCARCGGVDAYGENLSKKEAE